MESVNGLPIDSYRKTYRLRRAVPNAKCVEVTVPYEVIEREANRRGISVDEFIERFRAIAQYDSFDGVFYKFEPKKD